MSLTSEQSSPRFILSYLSRGVAQPGSASDLGSEGRRFESCLPDHSSEPKIDSDIKHQPT